MIERETECHWDHTGNSFAHAGAGVGPGLADGI